MEVEGLSKVNVDNVVGDLSSGHYLLENVRKRPIECFLCRLLMREASVSDDPPKSIYGCAECGKGFHVNCFTAFHGQEALSSKKEVLGILVAAVVKDKPQFRDRVSKNISSIENITLYCEDIIRKKQ